MAFVFEDRTESDPLIDRLLMFESRDSSETSTIAGNWDSKPAPQMIGSKRCGMMTRPLPTLHEESSDSDVDVRSGSTSPPSVASPNGVQPQSQRQLRNSQWWKRTIDYINFCLRMDDVDRAIRTVYLFENVNIDFIEMYLNNIFREKMSLPELPKNEIFNSCRREAKHLVNNNMALSLYTVCRHHVQKREAPKQTRFSYIPTHTAATNQRPKSVCLPAPPSGFTGSAAQRNPTFHNAVPSSKRDVAANYQQNVQLAQNSRQTVGSGFTIHHTNGQCAERNLTRDHNQDKVVPTLFAKVFAPSIPSIQSRQSISKHSTQNKATTTGESSVKSASASTDEASQSSPRVTEQTDSTQKSIESLRVNEEEMSDELPDLVDGENSSNRDDERDLLETDVCTSSPSTGVENDDVSRVDVNKNPIKTDIIHIEDLVEMGIVDGKILGEMEDLIECEHEQDSSSSEILVPDYSVETVSNLGDIVIKVDPDLIDLVSDYEDDDDDNESGRTETVAVLDLDEGVYSFRCINAQAPPGIAVFTEANPDGDDVTWLVCQASGCLFTSKSALTMETHLVVEHHVNTSSNLMLTTTEVGVRLNRLTDSDIRRYCRPRSSSDSETKSSNVDSRPATEKSSGSSVKSPNESAYVRPQVARRSKKRRLSDNGGDRIRNPEKKKKRWHSDGGTNKTIAGNESAEDDEPCRKCYVRFKPADTWKDPWIQCDCCDRWYHGSCQKLTPGDVQSLGCSDELYMCRRCRKKSAKKLKMTHEFLS